MWGTDSTLWGNHQWQIEAFRRFQMCSEANAPRIWNLKGTASLPPMDRPPVVVA